MRAKTLPIFPAFPLMGLADAMGPMSDGVKKQYELSNLVATLLPFFVFIAFALLLGWFVDLGWQETAFIVPVAAFAYLFVLSLQRGRKPTSGEKMSTMKA
jgi:hypothetical protein